MTSIKLQFSDLFILMVPTFDILNFIFWSTELPKKDETSETICVEFI